MDITITLTAQQASRVATALGHRYNLKDGLGAFRQATAQEAQEHILRSLRQVVIEQERQDALLNANIADF